MTVDTTGRAAHRRTASRTRPPRPRPSYGPPYPRRPEASRSWWLLLGAETPLAPHGCSTPEGPTAGCDVRKIRASDLYCRSHDAFLPLRDVRKPEHPLNPVGLLPRLLVAGLVWSAQFGSPFPIWALSFLLTAAVLLIPLRHWPVTWRTAAVGWAVTCVLVVAARWTSHEVDRVAATALLALGAVAVAVRCGGEAMTGASTRARREASARRAATAVTPGPGPVRGTHAAGPIAATLAPVPAAMLFLAVYRLAPDGRLAAVPGWARHWILLAAPTAVTGALLATLVTGALQGAGRIDRHVTPLTRPVPKPRRPVWTYPVRERNTYGTHDLAARLTGVCLRVGEHTLDAFLKTAAFAVGVLLAFGHLCLTLLRDVAEWLWRQTVLLIRRISLSLVMAKDALGEALPVAFVSAGTTLRAVALPLAGLTVAGVSLAVVADKVPSYLMDGQPAVLWPLLAALASAVLGITAAWTGLAGQPVRDSLDSARHSAETALPHVLLTAALTGWAISLPTWLGFGHITPGWLTYTLTACPVALMSAHVLRRTRGRDSRG
ncbi:hypothetical protein ACFV29_30890 [Streptomyces sp. NPDC059690]|uniref:hypothetical protein n=1 Tax=Streptomyces sp. NPDC059690 TaxID=3346907 RepID=UPI00368B3904